MNSNNTYKIELTDNIFDFLSQELPEHIITKLEPIKEQSYHRYDVFRSILQGLLGEDYEKY